MKSRKDRKIQESAMSLIWSKRLDEDGWGRDSPEIETARLSFSIGTDLNK